MQDVDFTGRGPSQDVVDAELTEAEFVFTCESGAAAAAREELGVVTACSHRVWCW